MEQDGHTDIEIYKYYIPFNGISITFPSSVSRTYTTGKPILGMRYKTLPLKIHKTSYFHISHIMIFSTEIMAFEGNIF